MLTWPEPRDVLRVDRRNNDFHFFYEIRAGIGDRPRAIFEPSGGNVDAVSRRVRRTKPTAGKITDHLIAAALNTGSCGNQTENVAHRQR